MKKIFNLISLFLVSLVLISSLTSCSKKKEYKIYFPTIQQNESLKLERTDEEMFYFLVYDTEYELQEIINNPELYQNKEILISSTCIENINWTIDNMDSDAYSIKCINFPLASFNEYDGEYTHFLYTYSANPGTYLSNIAFTYNEVEYSFNLNIEVQPSLSHVWTNSYPNGITLDNYTSFELSVFVDDLDGYDSVSVSTTNDNIVYSGYSNVDYSNNEIILSFYSNSNNTDGQSCNVTINVHTEHGETFSTEPLKFYINKVINYNVVASQIVSKIANSGNYSNDLGYYDVYKDGNVSVIFSTKNSNGNSFNVAVLSEGDGVTSLVEFTISLSENINVEYQGTLGKLVTIGTGSKKKSLIMKSSTYFYFDNYSGGTSSLKTSDQKLCQSLIEYGLVSLKLYCSDFASNYDESVLYYLGFIIFD